MSGSSKSNSRGLFGKSFTVPKGDQSWVFIGRTDAEAETPIFWPPDSSEKTLMLGKIEGRRRRGRQRMTWLDGIADNRHGFG